MTSRQFPTEVSGQKGEEIELEGLDSKQEILYSDQKFNLVLES